MNRLVARRATDCTVWRSGRRGTASAAARSDRDAQFDSRAGAGLASPFDSASDRLGSLPHPGKTEMRPLLGLRTGPLRVEANAVIGNPEEHFLAFDRQADGDPLCMGVLAYVGQRLRATAKISAPTSAASERPPASRVAWNGTASLEDSARLRGVLLEGRGEATLRKDRRRQAQDRLTDVHVQRSRHGRQLGHLFAGLGDSPGGQQLLHGLGLGVDVPEHLGHAVVHLTGDPLALALDGQRSQLVAEPGRLECQAHLGGQRRQGLQVRGGKRRGSAVANPMEPTRASP